MPFAELHSDARPHISLLQVAPNLFQLQTAFRYRDTKQGKEYVVRAMDPAKPAAEDTGNATDLASVPWYLWNLISSFGKQTMPALLHDQRCVEAQQLQATDPKAALALRRDADYQIERSLVDEDVAKFRAAVMWTAVSLSAYGTHARGKFGVLLLRLVVAVVCVVAAVVLWLTDATPGIGSYDVHGAAGWLLPLAALVVIVGGRERRLLFLGTLLLPLFAPVVVFQLVVSLVIYVLGLGVRVTKGGPMPHPAPYFRK